MVAIVKEIGTERRTTYDIVRDIEYRDYASFRLHMLDGSYVDVSNVRSLHKDAKCKHVILDVRRQNRVGF